MVYYGVIMALLWRYDGFYVGIMIGENRENHGIHDGYTLGCFNGKRSWSSD